ncbi:MAG: hypothetical protein ACK54L_15195, partial [Betaproteobacteria bacterium]
MATRGAKQATKRRAMQRVTQPASQPTSQPAPPAGRARAAAAAAPDDAALLERIRGIWERSRTQAARTVNTTLVCANRLIGQQIV